MTDDSRRKAMQRYLERHPGDPVAISLQRPDPLDLRCDSEYARVQWRDAVDDFVEERKIRTIAA
jgi:hypothetical protein